MSDKESQVMALRGWRLAAAKIAKPLFPLGYNLLQRLHARKRLATYQEGARNQLRPCEQRVYSQQGEDGILREIFFRIGQGNRYFVEFGVEDGSICNTALLASLYKWSGLYLEADAAAVETLRQRWADRRDIAIRQAFITVDNIGASFAEAAVPTEPDLLSIDIDGNDYWVWKALGAYHPRVVVIEYNAAYPPPIHWIMKYDPKHLWDGTTHFGASLCSLQLLGLQNGYVLLGTESRGLNAFFIRRDLLGKSGFLEASPEDAYHRPRYGALRRPFPYRDGPFVTNGL